MGEKLEKKSSTEDFGKMAEEFTVMGYCHGVIPTQYNLAKLKN